AHQIGDTSRFLFRRRNGNMEEYQVKWFKDGEPMTVIGPVPSPFLLKPMPASTRRQAVQSAMDTETVQPVEYPLMPRPFRGLPEFRKAKVPHLRAVRGIGAVQPLFTMPTGFQQRLGRSTRDLVFSGVLTASGLKIGFLRIPDFGDASNPFAANVALS